MRLFRAIPINLLTFLGLVIGVIVFFPYTSTVHTFDLPKEGEAAKETIIAPFTFDILKSPEELEKQRKAAMDKVLLVVDIDTSVNKRVRENLINLQKRILQLVDNNTPDSVKNEVIEMVGRELSDNTVRNLIERPYLLDDALMQVEYVLRRGMISVLLVPSTQRLNELRAVYNTSFERYLLYDKQYVSLRRDSIETAMAHSEIPVKEITLEQVIKGLKDERNFDVAALNCIYELLFAYLRPNVNINGTETARRKQDASKDVLAIKGKVVKDTEIVHKHQEVTAGVVEKLRSLREAVNSLHSAGVKRRVVVTNIGRLLYVLVLLVFFAFYVKMYCPRIAANTRHVMALATTLLIQVAIISIGLFVVPRIFGSSSEITLFMPYYVIPATVASMLITILLNMEIGFVTSIFIGLYIGIAHGFNLPLSIFTLLGGLAAGYSTRNIRYRWDFFKAIPPVFGCYALLILFWHVSRFELSFLSLVQNLGLAIINAIVATFIAMMATAIFETLFDITTNMTLVELSDMNNAVLKRLSIEAAGTYNHSVLVANLAESAAEKIGANSLLVRVASYYHDIGKLEKTDYFIENCLNNDRNRHNKLAPSMSALIISSHVKEGVELAKEHKLPRVIQDAILEHHGTSLVSFFYEKAREQDTHGVVQEKDFHYPGPRPQSRENAVIMLADSVEAASRSLATSSPKLLRELVKKIIRDKFMASQLDQCDLTLRDLDEIVEGFMPVLQGIFHTRIEYPNK